MYKLYGALASPYSQKMRAILRYRRIKHVWAHGAEAQAATAHVKAPVIPVLEFPDGTFANDSTPLIYALEEGHAARSIGRIEIGSSPRSSTTSSRRSSTRTSCRR